MKSLKHGASRWGRALLAVLALSVLGACGGGGTPIQAFAPTRIIAFGDESSVLSSTGGKYGINGINTLTNQIDCTVNPLWVQSVAAAFGLSFPQCDPNHSATPLGIMYAQAGDKVADVQAAIDSHFAVNYFSDRDIVTVLVGVNDILELYNQFPAQSESDLITAAKARGLLLAQQVNRIAQAGGKVIVSTLPDMGTTPFAIAERAAKTDTDRAVLLSQLSDAFNVSMRVNLINDGRMIGLILLDETTEGINKYPSVYGFTDVLDTACLINIAAQNCTSNTLVPGSSATTWMWATPTLMSPGGQTQLANLAITRAKNNPF